MSLSSLIVQREIATIREVEEALARQVLYGGDLVTNLFEVSRLEESTMTPLLAESYGMSVGPIGELPAPAQGSKMLVPAELAMARGMIPLERQEGKLVVAVSEPLAKDAEDELAFALGLTIEQRIAPSFRVRQAIAREYGGPLERRVQRLLSRISGEDGRMSSTLPPLLRDIPRAIEPPKPATPHPPALRLSPPPREAQTAPAPVAPHLNTQRGMPAVHEDILTEPAPRKNDTEPHVPPMDQALATGSGGVPRATLQRPAATSPAARPRRRRGPITSEGAYDELEEAGDRDAILNLFFDFCRQFFDYSALFIVQSDIAEGRDAFGDGAGRERVVTIGVPLDMPSVLSQARERGAPVLMAPATDGLDAVLLADLGRTASGPLFVAPIVVRTRVVALLLGDGGEAGVDEGARKEIGTFALAVGQAFERVIVRKKLGGYKAASGSSPPASKIEKEKVPSKNAPPPTVLSPRAQSMPPPSGAEVLIEGPAAVSSDEAPPPATLFQVRKPSGKPIPREEPHSLAISEPLPTTVDVRGQAQKQRREVPHVLTHATIAEAALAGARAEVERAEAQAAHDAKPRGGEVDYPEPTDKTVVLEVEPPRSPKVEPPPSQPPASSGQAVSVPARRPPSQRIERPELPSIIVDVRAELSTLVDRFLGSDGDEQAEGELLRQGQAAMQAIMDRFPGPIVADPERLAAITRGVPTKDPPIRVSECGPLLRLIAGQRRVALPFVLKKVDDETAENRFWATFLLTELVYPESAERIVPRLFDEELRTRKVARLVARALAEVAPNAIVEHLGDVSLATLQPSAKRVATVDILGELREPLAVPVLVSLLQDNDELVAQAAHQSLVAVTRQDFGNEPRKWLSWWSGHASQHRIEWLIDALMHDETRLRHAAGEELKATTKEYFGYYDDLPKRERERAQQRYRDWWSTEGRVRFRRP